MVNYMLRRAGRVVEGARLESVYTATYRGFESLALRHITVPSVNSTSLILLHFFLATR